LTINLRCETIQLMKSSNNKRKYVFGFSESKVYEEIFEAYTIEDAERLADEFAEVVETKNDSEISITHLETIKTKE
jgi:hypothetical protein